jgi:hypothetical protein
LCPIFSATLDAAPKDLDMKAQLQISLLLLSFGSAIPSGNHADIHGKSFLDLPSDLCSAWYDASTSVETAEPSLETAEFTASGNLWAMAYTQYNSDGTCRAARDVMTDLVAMDLHLPTSFYLPESISRPMIPVAFTSPPPRRLGPLFQTLALFAL